MKILALGGSGGMGRFAVHSLIKHPQVKSILVADLNESAAKKFASKKLLASASMLLIKRLWREQ